MKDELRNKILTSTGRALCGLYLHKRLKRSKLKEYAGSQYGYAIHMLIKLGLAKENEDGTIEITEKGEELAKCLCKCLF